MSAPTSTAVVSQRTKKRPPHPLDAQFAAAGLDRYGLDDFPTQPWGARAWCEHVGNSHRLERMSVWEPSANRGFLSRGLADYFGTVYESDIFDYGPGYPTHDFLAAPGVLPAFVPSEPDFIISNPPYVRALDFIEAALPMVRIGVAMLCRVQILEGGERHDSLFKRLGLRWLWSQFVERLPMNEAKCERRMKTASAYGWLTIYANPMPPSFICARRHIPACRARLEKPNDYEARQ